MRKKSVGRTPTREEVMGSSVVHYLTKDILRMSADKDVVDRYYDVLLAAEILKAEMEQALGR
ncbi:MAG: hypothetical protein V1753_02795 [Pseudomonadota bacterium]